MTAESNVSQSEGAEAPAWRVCLVSPRFPPDAGGVAVSTLRNAKLLAGAGLHVHVCVLDSRLAEDELADEAREEIVVHRVGGKPNADGLQSWFSALQRLHRRFRFDLLHAFYAVPAGYVAALAGRFLGRPVVVSARGNDVDRVIFEERRLGMLLWTLQNSSAVTAVSRELQEKISALVPSCAVRFVPNSVDATFYRPAPRDSDLLDKLDLDPLPTLLFSGEARRKKGLAPLLKAFALLQGPAPSNLILAGGLREEDRPVLDQFLRKNESAMARFRLLPYLPASELAGYYNLADIVLVPSLQDGMPNALLEAMACGRAVIASAVGGIVDVVADGVNGFLVPPGEARVLASAIQRLIEMPRDRERAGLRARRTVETRFTGRAELAANLDIYRTLVRA